MDQG
jgi:outer membrane immunogenic protein